MDSFQPHTILGGGQREKENDSWLFFFFMMLLFAGSIPLEFPTVPEKQTKSIELHYILRG
jgi:hypothetical protein